MTKEIQFDLDFYGDGQIQALTPAGVDCMIQWRYCPVNPSPRLVYQDAIKQGLHVRFDTALLRNDLASVPLVGTPVR